MTQAITLIQDALEKDQIYSPGDTIGDADAQSCLRVLNNMIDSWSTESLSCFAILEQSVALQPGKQSYTIGTVGSPDINATRPLRLLNAPGSAYIQDTNGNNYWVNVVEQDKWNLIGNRSPNTITSNIPDTLFYDPQVPLGILNFWPTENAGGYTAFWDSYLQLMEFPDLFTDVGLPPGYKLALGDCLARRVWRYFKAKEPIPADIEADAAGAKANIQRINFREQLMIFEPELLPRAASVYNVYSDRGGTA